MTVKGTLIATLAAGYLASLSPVAHAEDKAADKAPKAEGDKAACKGAGGCKGHDKKKAEKGAKGDKEAKEEKKAEPAPEPKK